MWDVLPHETDDEALVVSLRMIRSPLVLSSLWFVFMCFLRLPKSEEIKSHWLHFASHTREGWGLGCVCEGDWVYPGLVFLVICLHVLPHIAQIRWDVLTVVAGAQEKDEALVVSVRVIGSGSCLASCDVASFSWHNSIISTYLHINKLGTKQNCTHASALRRVQKGLRKEIKGTPLHCIRMLKCFSQVNKSAIHFNYFTVSLGSLNLHAVDT